MRYDTSYKLQPVNGLPRSIVADKVQEVGFDFTKVSIFPYVVHVNLCSEGRLGLGIREEVGAYL